MAVLTHITEITAPMGESEPVNAANGLPVGFTVEYTEGKVVLDEKSMEVGRPYTFMLGEVWVIALKREDGAIDFYQAA